MAGITVHHRAPLGVRYALVWALLALGGCSGLSTHYVYYYDSDNDAVVVHEAGEPQEIAIVASLAPDNGLGTSVEVETPGRSSNLKIEHWNMLVGSGTKIENVETGDEWVVAVKRNPWLGNAPFLTVKLNGDVVPPSKAEADRISAVDKEWQALLQADLKANFKYQNVDNSLVIKLTLPGGSEWVERLLVVDPGVQGEYVKPAGTKLESSADWLTDDELAFRWDFAQDELFASRNGTKIATSNVGTDVPVAK